jgi:hypothetical protein
MIQPYRIAADLVMDQAKMMRPLGAVLVDMPLLSLPLGYA